ncbi:MAG: hypothetical protein HY360_00375 [Verrucomicrobia bacterium]|nr:hypothetical protein [Verrucomicrobiota bacterium]
MICNKTRKIAAGTAILVLLALVVPAALAASTNAVILLAKEQIVRKKTTAELSLDLPEAGKGQQVRLSFAARVNYSSPCANNAAMTMTVNGKSIVGADLLNKPLEYHDKNGRDVYWALPRGTIWFLFSWPDFSFESVQACESPYSVDDVNPFQFVFDITARVKPGKNTVSFMHNEITAEDHYLVLRDVRVEVGDAITSKAGNAVQPAPTGAVPTYVPLGRRRIGMHVRLSDGGMIRVQIGDRIFRFHTRTSEPEGQWAVTTTGEWREIPRGRTGQAEWACQGYRIGRRVTVRDDHILIADTFTNTSNHLVGVMLENALALSEKPTEIKLGGGPHYARNQSQQDSYNPTVLARWENVAVGLVAEDDIFRAHVKEFARPEAIGLADRELGIEPGRNHTLEWSIYPLPQGDYWDFINAVRRNWGSNFTIPGPTSFVDWVSTRLNDEDCRRWLKSRDINMVCSYDAMFDQGKAAMGTAIPLAKKFCARTSEWMRQLHAVTPRVKALFYMNATLSTEPGAAEKYSDSRLLGPNGAQQTMVAGSPQGITMAPLFISTLDNSYGKAMLETVKYLVNDLKADGLYHDVFCSAGYGARAWNTAWDGCTVAIDPRTHAVTGKMSSVALLQQPWHVALVNYLRENDKIIIANGPMETRTLLNLKIPAFVETLFSYSSIRETHLGVPWGYGNHPTRGDGDYYRNTAELVRGLLEHGGVLAIPSWSEEPKELTFLHRMYPITPLELRSGMVIGEERILTKRSGRYGWPDGSRAETYVFDGDGKQVLEPLVKEIRDGNLITTEVRMPSDHFAILIRKRPGAPSVK